MVVAQVAVTVVAGQPLTEMSFHPFQHGQHGVRAWQTPLGGSLDDLRLGHSERRCHAFQRLRNDTNAH